MACGEMAAGTQPQEIEDEEHEQILERPAAVDTAKASGMACTTLPCLLPDIGQSCQRRQWAQMPITPVWAGVVGYSRR